MMDALRGVPFGFVPARARRRPETLAREVPFRTDRLTTRDGRRVDERRKTCWMGEPHVGSYAYSGKTMQPTPMAPVRGASARRRVRTDGRTVRFVFNKLVRRTRGVRVSHGSGNGDDVRDGFRHRLHRRDAEV